MSWSSIKLCNTKQVSGITTDDKGNIYFTSDNEYVYQIHQDNINSEPQVVVTVTQSRRYSSCGLNGIVWNHTNNTLYMCDHRHCRIASYSLDTQQLNPFFAGNGSWGHTDGALESCQFKQALGITVDKHGDLFVTDYCRIRKIDISKGIVSTVAGSERGHHNGKCSDALFNLPFGLVVSDDTIYVADWTNHCLRKIKDGIVSPVAGVANQSGQKNGPLSESLFSNPKALALDKDGTLFVGDKKGIRKIDLVQERILEIPGMPQQETRHVESCNRQKFKQHPLWWIQRLCNEDCEHMEMEKIALDWTLEGKSK